MRRVRGTRRLAATTLAAALAVAVLTGCATSHRVRGADKAGGSDAPLVLRLGDVDSEDYSNTTRVLEYFGEQVAKLSGGTLRVRVIYDAAGHERPDGEAQVARKVRDGSFDLGWIGAAAWDELGVTSFQALHAPFLVTDDVLLDRVATGPLAGSMLGGLREAGVQGLAVVPESLRNPVGLRRPLVSLGSFRGARLIVTPSRATDAALRALGATPVHALGKASGRDQRGQADGLLESLVALFRPGHRYGQRQHLSGAPHAVRQSRFASRLDGRRAGGAGAGGRPHACARRREASLRPGGDRPVLLERPRGLRHRRRSRRAREQSRARGSGACDTTRLLRARARSPHEEPDQPDPSAEAISPSRSRHPRSQRLLRPARVWAHRQHGISGDDEARRDLPLGADEG